jgi:hypothetical protein
MSFLDELLEKAPQMEQKSVLEDLTEKRMSTAVDEALKYDKEYNAICKEILDIIQKFDKSSQEWALFDLVLSASNAKAYESNRIAYQTGVLDGISLIAKLI